jgi:hypothetical protein
MKPWASWMLVPLMIPGTLLWATWLIFLGADK